MGGNQSLTFRAYHFLMKKFTMISTALAGCFFLSACAVTTAGVTPGDERNFARSLNDINADRVINARLKRAEGVTMGNVEVEVAEGVVVLSGSVPTEQDRIEAEKIAWSAPHVKQVGNELVIAGKQSFRSNLNDGLITTSVQSRLVADKYIKGRNINVETYEGKVYLLGVARNQAELERAALVASTTKGVKEVVSYVTLANTQAAPIPGGYDDQAASIQHRTLPDFLTTTPQTGGVDVDVEPYYIDPETGKQIPVSYIKSDQNSQY